MDNNDFDFIGDSRDDDFDWGSYEAVDEEPAMPVQQEKQAQKQQQVPRGTSQTPMGNRPPRPPKQSRTKAANGGAQAVRGKQRMNNSGRAGAETTTALPNPNQNRQTQKQKQERARMRQAQQEMQQAVEVDIFDEFEGTVPSSKKKGGKGILIALVLVFILAGGAFAYMKMGGKKPDVVLPTGFDSSGYVELQSALNSYDPEAIDSIVGSEEGDSYLAQEWAYANENTARQLFITNVCKVFSFNLPEKADGEVTVTLPDYQAIAERISTTDKEVCDKMLVVSGIKKEDYDFNNECTDLLMKYYNELGELPTTEVGFTSKPVGGRWDDDIELDKLLFSSDEFHNMCDEFDKIMTGFTGTRDEEYYADVEVHNPDYDRWYKLFRKYYDADNGKFHKGVSKWEPWYKRDSNNKLILDKNGKKIVNYYTVKDKNGKDWVQPAETVFVKKKKVRQVPVEYVAEYGVPHCFLGAYYCQNEYTGVLNADIKVGDGTLEHPAGVGTPVITHVRCTDGSYHDVRVTMKGYWVGKDAITYAITFSERNRGFDENSVVQLIAYEIEVENLESNPITFDSEMVLCDANSNQSARTGTLYSFTNEKVTLAGRSNTIINDWASSTEIAQKYVVWGKSFNRKYPTVYFKILAGTGNVPSYSAYKSFTGDSSLSGSIGTVVAPVSEEENSGEIDSESASGSENTSEGEEVLN